MARNIIFFFSENKEELSFIVQYESSPYLSDIAHTEKYTSIMKPYIETFNELKTQGLIKDLPAGVLQSLISGSVVSLARFCMNNPDALEDAALSVAIEAIWDMVRK